MEPSAWDARHAEAADRAVERFRRIVMDGPDLDEGALVIAAAHDPDLDILDAMTVLDDLAAQCPAPTIEALVRHLFVGPGSFRGNSEQYDDPRNSLLHIVLRRRLGIPISLAVVAIEVGRRIGVDLVGIGMPSHFLVRTLDPPVDGGPAFLDVFHGGRRLSALECEQMFGEMTGGAVPWDPRHLAPVDTSAVLVRMLTNLKLHHLRRNDMNGLRTVMRLRACFAPLARTEHDEFARLMAPTN